VLAWLHPGLKGDSWLQMKFEQARKASAPARPAMELYLALLVYRLTEEQTAQLILCLALPKAHAKMLTEAANIKVSLEELERPDIEPSQIYSILHGCGPVAIVANYVASDSPAVKERIALYLDRLHKVKPSLTGTDLQKLGIPPGPQMKAILRRLLDARLDGEVRDRRGEEKLVEGLARAAAKGS
jgi:tRNA nucleotidyltransferase (CCA-adding enzyme)